jgi:DNA-directed RNA polymerase specialized sigma24 family protein
MERLFTDVRGRPQEPVRHFLALAYTSMRNDVLDQLRQQKRAAASGARSTHTGAAGGPGRRAAARRAGPDLDGFGRGSSS